MRQNGESPPGLTHEPRTGYGNAVIDGIAAAKGGPSSCTPFLNRS